MELQNKKCSSVIDGKKCNAFRIVNDDCCYQHSKNVVVVAERAEARSKGGLNAYNGIKEPLPDMPLDTRDDARDMLADTVQRIRSGEIDSKTGFTLVSGLKAFVDIIDKQGIQENKDKLEILKRQFKKR